MKIKLDDAAMIAFTHLKELLVSTDVLAFPDFDKPFNLTTDASDSAIGAIFSQGKNSKYRPISFISRSFSKTEENYVTNHLFLNCNRLGFR